VEKGKLADLILLDADPLAAISNTKKIAAVVLNGRLFERTALEKVLLEVQAAANKN
jgi:imidazolonepropionase-like amidohydrolase